METVLSSRCIYVGVMRPASGPAPLDGQLAGSASELRALIQKFHVEQSAPRAEPVGACATARGLTATLPTRYIIHQDIREGPASGRPLAHQPDIRGRDAGCVAPPLVNRVAERSLARKVPGGTSGLR